jgi:hypothetical protein
MSTNAFEYHFATYEDAERLGSEFCDAHGEQEHGLIADEEYDKLFDHLASVLGRFGTFSEKSGTGADFRGYRYVDQIPWITITLGDGVAPSIAVQGALEAIETAHRPFAVSFDYYPDALLILPQRRVFTSFSESEVRTASGLLVPMRFPFAGVTIDFLEGWLDLTDSLPEGTPPTLGRGDLGRGALQFTTARYAGGEKPKYDKRVLQELLREFEASQQWSAAANVAEMESAVSKTFGAYADHVSEGWLTRVWYVSDGEHLAFVTYTAEVSVVAHHELDEAHQIVSSIRF